MNRYWTATKPHLAPDEIDRALIAPTGDARMDLGAALLGLHRMGEAACKSAATAPLVSEDSLASALIASREASAPVLVDSVSKSTEGPRYAALLARDLYDDAEQAAVSVFRHAVAKGVAPAVAAQRAGAVFGVPERELGKYRALAADPRIPPPALADAADRALLSYVEKVVGEEIKESVSKAPAVEERTIVAPDQTSTPYYDARDARGRFAPAGAVATAPAPAVARPDVLARVRQRYGLGRTAAPEVVAPTAEEVATRAAQEQTQQVRSLRALRTRRQQRQRQRTQAEPQTETQTETEVERSTRTRTRATRARQQLQQQRKRREGLGSPWVEDGERTLDLLDRDPTAMPHGFFTQRPTQPVTFVMPAEDAQAFLTRLRRFPPQMTRFWHIHHQAGGPPPAMTLDTRTEREAVQGETNVARAARDRGEVSPIRFEHISKAKIQAKGVDPNNTEAAYRQAERMASDWAEKVEGVNDTVIRLSPALGGDGWVAWHLNDLEGAPEQAVFEFVLTNTHTYPMHGPEHAMTGHVVDPNQAFRLAEPDEMPNTSDTVFDPQTGTVIYREFLESVPEAEADLAADSIEAIRLRALRGPGEEGEVSQRDWDFFKAETYTLQERQADVAQQARDERGRWTTTIHDVRPRLAERYGFDVPTAAPAQEQAQLDQLRQLRRLRQKRRQRTRTQPQTQTAPTEQQTEQEGELTTRPRTPVRRSLRLRQLLQRAEQADKTAADQDAKRRNQSMLTPPGLKSFDLEAEGGIYRVLNASDFDSLRDFRGEEAEVSSELLKVERPLDINFLLQDNQSGINAETNLRRSYWTQQFESDQENVRSIGNFDPTDADAVVSAFLRRNTALRRPLVGYVSDVPELDEAGEPTGRMLQVANATRPDPVYLIDMSEPALHYGGPIQLVYDSSHYQYDPRGEEDEELTRAPRTKYNFQVHRYRALPISENDADEG